MASGGDAASVGVRRRPYIPPSLTLLLDETTRVWEAHLAESLRLSHRISAEQTHKRVAGSSDAPACLSDIYEG